MVSVNICDAFIWEGYNLAVILHQRVLHVSRWGRRSGEMMTWMACTCTCTCTWHAHFVEGSTEILLSHWTTTKTTSTMMTTTIQFIMYLPDCAVVVVVAWLDWRLMSMVVLYNSREHTDACWCSYDCMLVSLLSNTTSTLLLHMHVIAYTTAIQPTQSIILSQISTWLGPVW